jgi:vitamin B12 transporter
VVVTATLTEEPISELGVSAALITLLRDVAGINVVQSGSRGGNTSVYIRGGEENFTLVLIDGVQVNQAGGDVDLSTLTTDNIERIEIIRGPQSALYGSDAIGGVIHIITKTGTGRPTIYASTSHGAHSENGNYIGEQKIGISGGISGSGEIIGYSFAFGRVDDQGILDVNNDYFNNTLSGRIDLYPMETLDLTFTARYTDTHFEFPTENGGDIPDSVFPGLDPDQFTDRREVVISGQTRFDLLPWWEHVLHLGIHRLNSDFEDPPNAESAFDAAPGSKTDSLETRFTFDYHTNVRFPEDGPVRSILTLGYEFDNEALNQDSFSTFRFGTGPFGVFTSVDDADEERNNHAYYLQEQITLFDRLHLVGGVRIEENSVFGNDVNPRGSIAHLDPEESFSWEAGLDQSFFDGKVLLGFTYFENEYDDLIGFVQTPFPPPAVLPPNYFNIQEAEDWGVEFTARVRPGFGLTIGGNYTFVDTEVTDDGGLGNLFFAEGKELLRRPNHSGSFFVDWLYRGLNVHVNGTYVGERDDTFFSAAPGAFGFYTFSSERVENVDHFILDVAASYTFTEFGRFPMRSLKIFARGRNVLDNEYEEVYGFSSPRFSAMGGLEVIF